MGITRDVLVAWRAIASGVVAKTSQTREKYWNHWAQYATTCGIDPWLQNTQPLFRDIVVSAFAARVRSGAYGRKSQVTVQSVTEALAAISKTIELAGKSSPIYRVDEKYQVTIERLVEGFRREDPASIPQLAVPVIVPEQCYKMSQTAIDAKTIHSGLLCLIAFYYLLRVGEYTKPRYVYRNKKKVRATRTVQFRVKDVGFHKGEKVISRHAPLKDLLTCDAATLRITQQKNHERNQTIHHKHNNTDICPVRALALLVHKILADGGTDEMLLCSYKENDEWHDVASADIVAMVKSSVHTLKLHENGITPELVGSHSLRAGGAMALKLNGASNTTIKKMGRWSSLTFLQYIHSQIAHLATDLSAKMSKKIPFINIAVIEPPSDKKST